MSEPETPIDVYADAASLTATSFSIILTLGVSDSKQPAEMIPKVVLRLSPQHAKAMAVNMMLVIQDYEKQHGIMDLPGAPYMELITRTPGGIVEELGPEEELSYDHPINQQWRKEQGIE